MHGRGGALIAPSERSQHWGQFSVASVGRRRYRSRALIVVLLVILFPLSAAPFSAYATDQTFSWDVSAVSGMAIDVHEKIPVTVSVGPVQASNVRILQSALLEGTTKRPLLDGTICLSQTDCGSVVTIPANKAQTLWLGTRGQPGTYSGSLTLASDEQPSGRTIASFTVYVSSLSYKLVGVVCIALGVVVAWLLTTVVRNELNARQLLLPISVLKVTLEQLGKAIADAKIAAPNTKGKIADLLLNGLSIETLRANGFPPEIPLPWTPLPNSSANVYQSYVQGISEWVTDLTVITDGFRKALTYVLAGNAANEQAVVACIAQIDLLSGSICAPSPRDLQAKINLQLSTLQQTLAALPALAAHTIGGAQVLLPTPGQLQMSIDRLSFAAWAWILVVTILVGAYVLIFSANGSGFGTPGDFLICFFWGVGLPSGAALLQSTTGSVSTTFGVSK